MSNLWMNLATSTLLATLFPLSGLRIDHVPIAVRDLPAAVAQFRALGFVIKPGLPPARMHGLWIGFVERSKW
jgi:hypothetical protein